MQHIDIEQIMAEIRAEIKEKGYTEQELKFQDIALPRIPGKDYGEFDYDELCYEYAQCNKNWNNPMCFPFPPGNPVKIALQKGIRKISKCVFWPIVNYQNTFNRDMVRFQNQVKYYIEMDRKLKQEYEEKICEIQEKNNEKLAALSRQLMAVKWKQIDSFCEGKETEDDILVCRICGHQAARRSYEKKVSECIFNGGRLERYVCPECGVIFGPTKFSALTQKEIDEDYQIHYYGFHEGSSFDKEIEAFYMLKPDKEGIYLNYGCGCWSKSIQRLREDGYNVYGYEPYAPETDNPYMITSKEDVAKMRFNGIYSNDLLEHLIEPVEDLKFMKTLLMNPAAKMSHSTSCYTYKQEFTRFHTHFFTGKSLEVICDRVGLEILDSRDALESRDFICYVYGMKEDGADYKPIMQLSERKEEAERKENTILLHERGIICGPYIRQGKGTYTLSVEIELPEAIEKVNLSITADKGIKKLTDYELVDGVNTISYTLRQMEEDVEFVIINDYDKDIVVRNIRMC